MKRWAIRIFLLLLLGAIVNVVVAWGCGYWVRLTGEAAVSGTHVIDHDHRANLLVFRAFGSEQVVIDHACRLTPDGQPDAKLYETVAAAEFKIAMMEAIEPRRDSVLPTWARIPKSHKHVRPVGDGPWTVRHEFTLHDARGWPVKSLLSRWQLSDKYFDWDPMSRHESLLNEDRGMVYWASTERVLPLRPISPGFAINTVFYAVVLWLLFAGPFMVRRWRRIRRGLCPKCAYDLRGSAGATACPECGNAVRPERVEPVAS